MTDFSPHTEPEDRGSRRRGMRQIVFMGALFMALLSLSVDVVDDLWDLTEELEISVASALLGLLWQFLAACGLGLAIAIIFKEQRRRALQDAQSAETMALMRGELHAVMQARFTDWGLTAAESDVAVLILKGMTGAEISQARETAPGTVRAQTSAIFKKSGVTARAEFLALFLDEFLGAEAANKVGPRKGTDCPAKAQD